MKNRLSPVAFLRSLAAQCETGSFDRKTSLPCDALAAREILRLVGEPYASTHSFSMYAEDGAFLNGVRLPMVMGETPEQSALRRSLCALMPNCRDHFTRAIARRFREERTPHLLSLRQRMMRLDLTPKAFKYERAVGVEFETISKISSETLSDALPIWCRVASDTSIVRSKENPCTNEVRAMFTRSELEPRLFRLCERFKTLGLSVNKSCGLHVHFDMRGRRSDEVHKIAARADKWFRALQELVPASRRENQYCKFGISKTDRYRAVNFVSFGRRETLEIRLHSGTVDYSKTLAWVRLCELILALKSGPRVGDCLGTLSQLPLAEHDLAYWRTRHAQLNPHMYSETARATSESE